MSLLRNALSGLRRGLHRATKPVVDGRETKRRPRSFRPMLEQLEEREVPAAIGMNLEPTSNYMGGWMFTDAIKASDAWHRVDIDTATGNWTRDLNIPIDRRTGNPTLLRQWTDASTGHLIQQAVNTGMFVGIGDHYPSGPYTAWWRGDGIVDWGGDVNRDSIRLSTALGSDGLQYYVATFTVTPGISATPAQPGLGIQMTVTGSSASDADPIHDVHVWMPDYNGHSFVGQFWHPGADFSPFHPLFTERLAPFGTLRVADVVSNSNVVHWSDVRPWDFATQVTGDPADGYTVATGFHVNGIAPEYIVALANELHANPWINIPHMAQDDYVSNVARLVHGTLNSNQHVYLEWSNEVWNTAPGFDASSWITAQLALPENAGLTREQFIARQETHVFDIWSGVFSDHPGQLVRVVAGQDGNDYYNAPLLAAMDQLGHHFDAFAVGAYFHAEPWHANTSVDQVLGELQASIPTLLTSLRDARRLADQYHVSLLAYEGGPALEAQYLPEGDLTRAHDIEMLNRASQDPRMYRMYSDFLHQLDASDIHLDLLNHEQYTGRVSLDGEFPYGALSYQDERLADAPQYRALLDYVAHWQIPALPPALRFSYRRQLGFGGFQLQNNAAISMGTAPFVCEQVAGVSLLNPTLQGDVNASNSQTLAVGLAARIQSNGNAYVAALTHDATAEILLFNGARNTFTVLASAPAGTNAATLQFVLNGPALSLFMNRSGTPLLSVNDTTLVSAGGAGLFAWGPNGIIGNFSVSGF